MDDLDPNPGNLKHHKVEPFKGLPPVDPTHSVTFINYRILLKKYMKHVMMEEDGSHFLVTKEDTDFTDKEWEVLTAIAREL